MTNKVTLTQDQIDAVKAIVKDALWDTGGTRGEVKDEIDSRLEAMCAPEPDKVDRLAEQPWMRYRP